MTATPPARYQLWHPTRGISFSPTLRASEPSLQEPLVLDEGAIATINNAIQHKHNSVVRETTLPESVNIQPRTPKVIARENNAPTDSSRATTEDVGEKGQQTGADQKTIGLKPPPAILDFEIMEDLFYAAKRAPPGSSESYWSYNQYRGPLEDGKPRKVKVHYCRSKHTMERVCQQYFMDEEILGFDLEWAPGAMKHQDIRRNVSLIQLASPSRIGLFHVALFTGKDGFVAPSFKKIMEDSSITKVGVAIKGDATRVRNFMEVDSKGLLELSHLYRLVTFSPSKQYRNINKKLVPLATQVEQYLRLPLFKGHSVRSSNWTKPLNMDQIFYSASDAYAGLQLYATLEYHRKQLNPCPPTPHHAELDLPIRLADDIELTTNDEATDTPEPIMPPYPTISNDDVISVLESIKVEDLSSLDEKQKASTSSRASAKQPPSVSKHPFVEAAEDRALHYQEAHPDSRATFIQLRAYYLWYNNDLDPMTIARLLRDPPLQESTVITYVLSAIKYADLPYDKERLRDELAIPLPFNLRSKWPVAAAVVED